jgi:hypothetical protein
MKTIKDLHGYCSGLTEQQWAKIHGYRAGVSNYLASKNKHDQT